MLNNSSARAHLKAKIPTKMNQEQNMVTMPLKSYRSFGQKDSLLHSSVTAQIDSKDQKQMTVEHLVLGTEIDR